MSKPQDKKIFLVFGRTVTGGPAQVLVLATSLASAITRVNKLSRLGNLNNSYGGIITGPFSGKEITRSYLEKYLVSLEDKYPHIYLEGSAGDALESLLRGEPWYFSWERDIKHTQLDLPLSERPSIPAEEGILWFMDEQPKVKGIVQDEYRYHRLPYRRGDTNGNTESHLGEY